MTQSRLTGSRGTDTSTADPALERERAAILALLLSEAAEGDAEAVSAARSIADGCMREGHLWRAMRLESRAELRALFERYFPGLAAANVKDMRWKRFLYKRLCGWPGFDG